MPKFSDLKYKVLPHVPYSQDLTPSDYFLNPNLMKGLETKRIGSKDDIISDTVNLKASTYLMEGVNNWRNPF